MTKEQKFWTWVILLPLLIGILWLIFGAFSLLLAAEPFSDSFEAYNLGDLSGQGGWQHLSSTGHYFVIDTEHHTGAKSVEVIAAGTNGRIDNVSGELLPAGSWSFWFKKSAGSSFIILLQGENSNPELGCGELFLDTHLGKVSIYDMAGGYPIVDFDDTPYAEWFKITTEWDFGTGLYRAKLNEGAFSGWQHLYADCESTGFKGVRFFYAGTEPLYLDDIGEITPPPARVWGITPASETEITDLNTTFEFGWEGLDDWDSLSVVFKNRPTGIFTTGKEFLIEEIGTSGEMELNLLDFNFDRNGKFYFFATATKMVPEIIEGMFLTGRQSYEWSEDLVSPEYYLTINVGGYTPIYEMSNFTEWYGTNAKFDEPTAMFLAITGFFEPVFNKIGEFGNRISDYFNTNESYTQGYEIGKAVPYFTYFIGQVDFFLGGFPIMKWLFVIILLLTGIFIFRLILKFIPGLG